MKASVRRLPLLLLLGLLLGLQTQTHTAAAAANPVVRLPQTGTAAGVLVETDQQGIADVYAGPEELLLVSLLDGRLAALDSETGERLWDYDTQAPLVSAPGVVVQPTEGKLSSQIVPRADGSLYLQHAGVMQNLAVSVPELVEMAPSQFENGPYFMGGSFPTLYLLDPRTGQLLAKFAGQLPDLDNVNVTVSGSEEVRPVVDLRDALIVARKDYAVWSLDMTSQVEPWNVTYSRIQLLPPPALDPGEDGPGSPAGAELSWTGILEVAAGDDSTLVSLDPETRAMRWTVQLDSPVVAAFNNLGYSHVLQGLGSDVLPAQQSRSKGAVTAGTRAGSPLALPAADQSSVDMLPVTWQPHGFGLASRAAVGPLGAVVGLPGSEDTCVVNQSSPHHLLAMAGSSAGQLGNHSQGSAGGGEAMVPGSLQLTWLHLAAAGALGAVVTGLLVYAYWSRKRDVPQVAPHAGRGAISLDVPEAALELNRQEASLEGASHIQDPADSGLENIPEQGVWEPDPKRPNARRRKLRHPRYSNRLNGVLQQADGQPAGHQSTPDTLAPADPPEVLGSVESSKSSKIRTRVERDGVIYVGRMEVFKQEELGRGSNGTIVYAGMLDGRPVAIKRMQAEFVAQAEKENNVLVLSDEHPNILRCFAMEEDSEFVYLALERCKDSLAARLALPGAATDAFVRLDGSPTEFAMQVAEDVGQGLLALHDRGIVHRDLKPHNVLLTEGRRAKLSDMGLCKQLRAEQSSFDSAGTGGSSGWQAPETMVSRSGGDARLNKGVDVFSFGLILFYCLTGGKHAFGEFYEREWNILQDRPNLGPIGHLPEAQNLIGAMLAKNPKKRPSMRAVMAHPMWWSAQQRLAFLIHLSDRVENEDREEDPRLLRVLESCAGAACGADWAGALEAELLANLGRYRKYNRASLRDLLRVMRNKHNHFREMPETLQAKLAPVPEGFLRYFTSRFPKLLLTTYGFALHHCPNEPPLDRYFVVGSHDFVFVEDPGAASSSASTEAPAGLAQSPKPDIVAPAGIAPAAEVGLPKPAPDEQAALQCTQPVTAPLVPEQTHEAKSSASVTSSPGNPEPSSSEAGPGATASQEGMSQPRGASISHQHNISADSSEGALAAFDLVASAFPSKPSSALGTVSGEPTVKANGASVDVGKPLSNGNDLAPDEAAAPSPDKQPAEPATQPSAKKKAQAAPSAGKKSGQRSSFMSLLAAPLHARRSSQEAIPQVDSQPAVTDSPQTNAAKDDTQPALAAPPPPPPAPSRLRGGFFQRNNPAKALAAQHAQQQAQMQAQQAHQRAQMQVQQAMQAQQALQAQQAMRAWSNGSTGARDAAPGSFEGNGFQGALFTSPPLASFGDDGSFRDVGSFSGSLGSSSAAASLGRVTNSSSSLARLSPGLTLAHTSPAHSLARSSPAPSEGSFSSGSFTRSLGPMGDLVGSASGQTWAPPPPPPPVPSSAGLTHGVADSLAGLGTSMWADSRSPLGTSWDGSRLVRNSWPGMGRREDEGGLAVVAALQRASMGSRTLDGGAPLPELSLRDVLPADLGFTQAEIDASMTQADLDASLAETYIVQFPKRPGEKICDFYVKTGHCKYHEQCRYDHPAEFAVHLNKDGLPLRPGVITCSHYEKHGQCKFGPACKWHHPLYKGSSQAADGSVQLRKA